MVLALSAVERQAILAKYVLAYGEDVEALAESVEVENGSERRSFSVNDPVTFERHDPYSPKQPRKYRGTVVVFLRMTDARLRRRPFGVVLIEDQFGARHQYRVPIETLDHDLPTNS